MINNRQIKAVAVLTVILIGQGCSWMRSLRQEAYGDEFESKHKSRGLAAYEANRLPPPATVMDQHLNSFRGEPVDMSGVRAKAQRTTKNDFVAMNAKNENSLWKSDGQTNYFFAVNKNKVPGDLITVIVDESLKMDMHKELKRIIHNEDYEKGVEISGFGKVGGTSKQPTAVAAAGQTDASGAAAAPAAELSRDVASTQMPVQLQYIAEVMEVFPNGNMLIRGVKRVPYDGKVYLLEVTSILKSSDVPENNVVESAKFFEHKTEIVR